MSVIKLNSTHKESVQQLFQNRYLMGLDTSTEFFHQSYRPDVNWTQDSDVKNQIYRIFCSVYLNDLSNFHAYGLIEDNHIKSAIALFESDDEPAWYITFSSSLDSREQLTDVLDKCIEENELAGKLKFYELINLSDFDTQNRNHWGELNKERYDFYDEYVVPAHTKCYYQNSWELLFNKTLMPADTMVRCNYLKSSYRNKLPIGGNI